MIFLETFWNPSKHGEEDSINLRSHSNLTIKFLNRIRWKLLFNIVGHREEIISSFSYYE